MEGYGRGGNTVVFTGSYLDCTGQLITWTAKDAHDYRIVSRDAGQWIFTAHENVWVEGTTASGEQYLGHGAGSTTEVIPQPSGGAVVQTFTGHRVSIIRGPTDNVVHRFTLRWVIDATGRAVVDQMGISHACRG